MMLHEKRVRNVHVIHLEASWSGVFGEIDGGYREGLAIHPTSVR